jgi:hypothetical protein
MTQRMFEMDPKHQTIIDEKGTGPAIVRASRVKDVVSDIAQGHQVSLNANRHDKLLRGLLDNVFGIDC